MKKILAVSAFSCLLLLALVSLRSPEKKEPVTLAVQNKETPAPVSDETKRNVAKVAGYILAKNNAKHFTYYKADRIGDKNEIEWRKAVITIDGEKYDIAVAKDVQISIFVGPSDKDFTYLTDSGMDGNINSGSDTKGTPDFFDDMAIRGTAFMHVVNNKFTGPGYQAKYEAALAKLAHHFEQLKYGI